jgi:glycine betaine/choline ABC-type transport system substrate-binding protein
MNGKNLMNWGAMLAAAALLGSSCGGSRKPIVVGAKSTTMGAILGEIMAQHLEHRLGRTVQRHLNLGNTQLAYQALMNGEVGLYPEEAGTVQAQILKESVSTDAASAWERVRNEMRRISQMEVLDPLGIDNSWAVVVPKAASDKMETLSDAASAKPGWKLGVSRDFNERSDGLAAFNQYRLPMGALTRVTDPGSLYAALTAGELTMLVGNLTDGPLARHDDWKILRDDKKVFPTYQTCVIIRMDLLAKDPKIQTALAELSGKITNDAMRKLDAQVDVDHKKPGDVAAEFLAQAGLK